MLELSTHRARIKKRTRKIQNNLGLFGFPLQTRPRKKRKKKKQNEKKRKKGNQKRPSRLGHIEFLEKERCEFPQAPYFFRPSLAEILHRPVNDRISSRSEYPHYSYLWISVDPVLQNRKKTRSAIWQSRDQRSPHFLCPIEQGRLETLCRSDTLLIYV